AALDDLEDQPIAPSRRIKLEELALVVAVVKNVLRAQKVSKLWLEAKAGFDVVIIVRRDFERGETRFFQRTRGGENIAGRDGDVLNARAKAFADKTAGERAAIFRAVQRQAERAVFAFDHLTAHDTCRIDDVDHRRFAGAENGSVKQEPGQHLTLLHRLTDVVDRGKPCTGFVAFDPLEIN